MTGYLTRRVCARVTADVGANAVGRPVRTDRRRAQRCYARLLFAAATKRRQKRLELLSRYGSRYNSLFLSHLGHSCLPTAYVECRESFRVDCNNARYRGGWAKIQTGRTIRLGHCLFSFISARCLGKSAAGKLCIFECGVCSRFVCTHSCVEHLFVPFCSERRS